MSLPDYIHVGAIIKVAEWYGQIVDVTVTAQDRIMASRRTQARLGFGKEKGSTQQHRAVGGITMLKDVIEVKPLEDYHVHLRFEDGREGIVDIKSLVEFDGVFEPLADPEYFAKVEVNPDLGTVVWPNGADLDPDMLYSAVTGEALPEPEAASSNNPDD